MSIETTITSLLEQAKEFKAQSEIESSVSEVSEDEISEIKEIPSVKEDIEALFNGEDGLTEEFRKKAETIFETAVITRVKEEVARIKEELQTSYYEKLQEEVEKHVEGLVEKIDGYLNFVVEKWMEENAIALETSLKADILESFIHGMRNLFKEHYIEIPEEKYDVMAEMEKQIQVLTDKLNESVDANIKLRNEISEMKKAKIIEDACEGLSVLQAEKLKILAEEIAFSDIESFAEKVKIIRENYFNEEGKEIFRDNKSSILTEEVIQEEKIVPAEMQEYVKTISMLLR